MADVVCTGWLKKSPPATKMSIWGVPIASCTSWGQKFWKDRWCVLKKRGSTYYLEYYKNEWATRPKGEIDLSKCEQVIEGLEFENRRNLLNAHIFNIVTSKRTYYLVTKTEDDMFRWVRNICRVCGFINEEPPQTSEVT
ncbi:GRB2-associated-binding protein 2-like, partial [Saccoglossus kowalevskii]|uniref:GRB2-associated-binding protein 2-like n=1 Tax=Saccoglossus kowalevskii TaxID=10224 RepID=A0ABM0MCQ2_SACKO